jgi:plastocyanin
MPDWSIKIVSERGTVAFQPNLKGAKPGDPLRAQQDDLVTWNNTTSDTHQPWPLDANGQPMQDVPRDSPNYLSDPILAGSSSRPQYDAAAPSSPPPQQWTVNYCCKDHPSERGSIIVIATPTTSVNIDASGGTASFSPQSTAVNPNDQVNWNNNSGEVHQPWPANSDYTPQQSAPGQPNYLSDPIAAGDSSLCYTAAQPSGLKKGDTWTVYFICKNHPDAVSERGTINGTAS